MDRTEETSAETSTAIEATATSTASEEHDLEALLAQHEIEQHTIDALKEKFPHLYVLIDAPVIFKPMTNAQFERLSAKNEKEKAKGARELAGFLVVYPSPAEWRKMTADTEPGCGIWSTVIDAAVDVYRRKPIAEAKKL